MRNDTDFKIVLSEQLFRVKWYSSHMNDTEYFGDMSTLIYIMVHCRQTTKHYLSQCGQFLLTHLPLLPYICVGESGQHLVR